MKSRFHEAADVRFPYSLMYIVEEHELYILAIAHQSKRPGYWADRVPADE
jgi:hypothetical protein